MSRHFGEVLARAPGHGEAPFPAGDRARLASAFPRGLEALAA